MISSKDKTHGKSNCCNAEVLNPSGESVGVCHKYGEWCEAIVPANGKFLTDEE